MFTYAFRGYAAFRQLLDTLNRGLDPVTLRRIQVAVLLWQKGTQPEDFLAENLRISPGFSQLGELDMTDPRKRDRGRIAMQFVNQGI